MKLLGIDPGGETGWATWNNGEGNGSFDVYGTLGPDPHFGALWRLLTAQTANTIICESFEHHKANEAAELVSLQYEGVVRAFAEISGVRLVMQQSAAKKWADDRKLHKLGLYHTHHDRHAADARRHILYYLAHNLYVEAELRTATLRRLK